MIFYRPAYWYVTYFSAFVPGENIGSMQIILRAHCSCYQKKKAQSTEDDLMQEL